MRAFAAFVAVALCAACGQSEAPEAAPRVASSPEASVGSRHASSGRIDPAAVARVRTALPDGYEVADLSGPTAPVDLWGLGADWSASPAECSALANPVAGARASGWSASGPGGIVYAVVAPGLVAQDPPVDEPCQHWTVSGGSSDGSVSYLPAPSIDRVLAVGLATDVTTRVEGGTETHLHAETFTAYLDEYVAYVVVVTDPGSSGLPLPPGFAADVLVKTVSAIHGSPTAGG